MTAQEYGQVAGRLAISREHGMSYDMLWDLLLDCMRSTVEKVGFDEGVSFISATPC